MSFTIRCMTVLLIWGFFKPSYGQLLAPSELDTVKVYTDLTEALKHPAEVKKLDLKRNKLQEFPIEILQLKNLQSLSLKHNKLKEFPKELAQLNMLQELDLSGNEIDTVYPEIGELVNLYYLNMNNNEITALPKEIGNLSKLEVLDLWSNYIEHFPDEMRKLTALKEIDLRAILLNDEDHARLFTLMPKAKIRLSHSCNCNK